MTGEIGILNVGAGDTKLTFDKNNPAECIRSARIVKDMLRRGYALLVEVERNGEKAYERVREFREDVCSYVIADFDPEIAAQHDAEEETSLVSDAPEITNPASDPPRTRGRQKGKTKLVHASEARGVAVARSAGG